MPMDNPSNLKNLLLQVSRPVFAVQNNGSMHFTDKAPELLSEVMAFVPAITPSTLGDKSFRKRHGIRFPYIAGAMANGICSSAMVETMAEHSMMGFFGAGGLSIEDIQKNIVYLKGRLGDRPFGFNLIHSPFDSAHEMAVAELYLKHGITRISAAAFMQMTPALVLYRVKGIHEDSKGRIITPNHVIAKVSRIEVARQFFSPPPEKIIKLLVEKKLITTEEARLSQHIPMAWDLTAEADSGGHTDNRPALALLPTMLALKNEFMEKYRYDEPICIGLAGGIATPEAAAAAFEMGAAYILTGSVNQSCVEAGICDEVKTLLCQAQQADVAMAPAADMFEIGAKVQVLKRGTMFALRAAKLYNLYKSHTCFEEIDPGTRQEIENKILRAGFEQAWESTKQFFLATGQQREVHKAQNDPKHKMALVFRSYLGLSSKWAIQGIKDRKMDYQIWCGPSMGAFNQWAKSSFLEAPENRRTAEIALNLLLGACFHMRAAILKAQGIEPDAGEHFFRPMKKNAIYEYMSQSPAM